MPESTTSHSMKKMLFYVGIFFVIVFGWYGVKKLLFWYFMSHYQPPAVSVSSTKANSKTWRSYLTSVGSLTAINGVDLSTEVSGIVQEIRFNSGQFVKKGDTIIRLNTDVEKANLRSNQAKLALAKINFERINTLFKKNVSSQSALDTVQAELLQAQAGVEYVEGQIRQKTITAPFDGRLGIRQINIGQYISAGTNMVTLQALNPLYVNFTLPEQYLPNIYINQPIDISVNFGKDKTVKGKITAINSKVDQVTRNISVQATIPNDNLSLYPGMYALVNVWMKEQKNVIVVPQTAISYSLSGDYIFIIKNESEPKKEKDQDLHVYRKYVKVGERRDNEASITSGITQDDVIVTSGQLKLQNGTPVVINNSVELS